MKESRCREAAVLAEDHRGCGSEWDVDSGVLPAAPLEGKPILLVATQTEGQLPRAGQARCLRGAASFALVSEDGADLPAGLDRGRDGTAASFLRSKRQYSCQAAENQSGL